MEHYLKFAADLPQKGTITFSSAEENEEFMQQQGVNQQVRQLRGGHFRADLAVLETDYATFIADRFKNACTAYIQPPAGTAAILVFDTLGERLLASGGDVLWDKIVVLPDGSGIDLVSSDYTRSESIVMPQARLAKVFEAVCPNNPFPERASILTSTSKQRGLFREALVNAIAHPHEIDQREVLPNLIAQMVASGNQTGTCRLEHIKDVTTRIHIAIQARDYIEDHFRETVRITDLCRLTGTGVRTLQRCFKEYFDLTLTEYLKSVRLEATRRMLRTTRAEETTVTAVALRNGFAHLGRFSAEYRRCFGESPKHTLTQSG